MGVVACAAIVAVIATSGSGEGGDGVRWPLTASGPPPPPPPPAPVRRFNVGSGPTGAVVIRRADRRRRPVVIFLHGWQIVGRQDYRGWLAHLARRGATVIAPRYQVAATPPEAVLGNALEGVRAALRRFPGRTDDVTVTGHSAGGALAADYAAEAAREGLPPARRVLAVYPGRAIRGTAGIPAADLSRIPSDVRLVVMVSAADQVVGEGPGRELFAAASGIPEPRRTLVQVRDAQVGGHYAPTAATAAARRVFWRRLDRLIALP